MKERGDLLSLAPDASLLFILFFFYTQISEEGISWDSSNGFTGLAVKGPYKGICVIS